MCICSSCAGAGCPSRSSDHTFATCAAPVAATASAACPTRAMRMCGLPRAGRLRWRGAPVAVVERVAHRLRLDHAPVLVRAGSVSLPAPGAELRIQYLCNFLLCGRLQLLSVGAVCHAAARGLPLLLHHQERLCIQHGHTGGTAGLACTCGASVLQQQEGRCGTDREPALRAPCAAGPFPGAAHLQPLMRALPALLQARWSSAQREAAARVAQTPRRTARPPQKHHLRGRQLGLSALQRTARPRRARTPPSEERCARARPLSLLSLPARACLFAQHPA